MVSPSAFVVFRLITSSYLVGACTGRLAGAFEDTINVVGSMPKLVDSFRTVRHQAPAHRDKVVGVDCRQFVSRGKCDDLSDMWRRNCAWRHDQAGIWRAGEIRDGAFDVAGIANINRAHVDPKRRCSSPDGAELSDASRIGGIPDDRSPSNAGRNLLEQFYPFSA